jgi:hypothetical protein
LIFKRSTFIQTEGLTTPTVSESFRADSIPGQHLNIGCRLPNIPVPDQKSGDALIFAEVPKHKLDLFSSFHTNPALLYRIG